MAENRLNRITGWTLFLASLVIVGLSVLLYAKVLYPWFYHWGATPEEQALTLPGDELAPPGAARLTRAITIQAPADRVWPWLIQIGQDRAGFYSNDWLENIFLAGMNNGDEIRPEWQHRAIGDAVLMTRPDYLGGRLGDTTKTFIRTLEPGRAIGETPGTFVLVPIDDHTTRLLLRENSLLADPIAWDPMHFVMERGMLYGIQARAEGRTDRTPAFDLAVRIGWGAGLIALVALFIQRRGWIPWLIVPIVVAMPIWLTTGDLAAVTAGALAAGIPVFGALRFGWRWPGPLLVLIAAVFLTLLIVPDSYALFGLAFGALAILALGRRLQRIQSIGHLAPARRG